MGLKWPFLLMYGSHDMRHIGFRGLKGCQRDPRDSGRHKTNHPKSYTYSLELTPLYLGSYCQQTIYGSRSVGTLSEEINAPHSC